jgi:hypothetical protein
MPTLPPLHQPIADQLRYNFSAPSECPLFSKAVIRLGKPNVRFAPKADIHA